MKNNPIEKIKKKKRSFFFIIIVIIIYETRCLCSMRIRKTFDTKQSVI